MGRVRGPTPLFSLRGMMELERDLERRELRELDTRFAVHRAARLASEQRIREEYVRLADATEKRRLAEGQREREQSERLRAMCDAILEKARAEVEARARIELATQQHEHERRMERERSDARRSLDRKLAVAGFSAAAVCVLLATALYYFELRPRIAELRSGYEAALAAEKRTSEQASSLADRRAEENTELEKRVRKLESELAAAKAGSPGSD